MVDPFQCKIRSQHITSCMAFVLGAACTLSIPINDESMYEFLIKGVASSF